MDYGEHMALKAGESGPTCESCDEPVEWDACAETLPRFCEKCNEEYNMENQLNEECRAMIKQLIKHSHHVHQQCDLWVARQDSGKYTSMLALTTAEGDTDGRRKILADLAAILRDGDISKLEEGS